MTAAAPTFTPNPARVDARPARRGDRMTTPTAEIVTIPFKGGEILAANVNGKPYVVLRPALESIGLNADRQIAKLQTQPWATTAVTAVVASDGRARDQVTCDVRSFLMLLATVPSSRVSAAARPRLVEYQNEVADAIEAYWTKGGVINPAATPGQLDAIDEDVQHKRRVYDIELRSLEAKFRHDEDMREMELINSAESVDPPLRGNLSLHLIARRQGTAPAIAHEDRLLTVDGYLDDRGVSGADVRSIRSTFGKRLKAAYVEAYGTEPGEVLAPISGRERMVKAYYEKHRHLFDQVFDGSYAHLAPAMLPGVAA